MGATRLIVSTKTHLHRQNPGVREAILSGLVTGLAIAMPVGAVAALIVALTVRTSFRVGLGAAVGVATVDGAYAARTANKAYRTTPLRGRWQHAPYFHDGSAATLADVVAHYNRVRKLDLTAEQQRELIEYLKSL